MIYFIFVFFYIKKKKDILFYITQNKSKNYQRYYLEKIKFVFSIFISMLEYLINKIIIYILIKNTYQVKKIEN